MNSTALIPVFNGELDGRHQQLCDARDLHDYLGVGRHFSNWIKERIEKYGLIEGYDFKTATNASVRGEAGRGGRNRVDYHLSLDAAKSFAMIENNELGRKIRTYFIAMEKAARNSTSAQVEISPAQRLALNKQLTSLLKSIRTEKCEAISLIQYEQIKHLCCVLEITAPPYHDLAAPEVRKGELFPRSLYTVK